MTAARTLLRHDDVVFPVLHGTYGEDGTVQGLLELADIAYVGRVRSARPSAWTRTCQAIAGTGRIPVVPWRLVTARALERERERALAQASELGFPVFVKPPMPDPRSVSARSRRSPKLEPALRAALVFDSKGAGRGCGHAREIECACSVTTSRKPPLPAEIIVHHKDGFYSYDAKYVDADGADAKIRPTSRPS